AADHDQPQRAAVREADGPIERSRNDSESGRLFDAGNQQGIAADFHGHAGGGPALLDRRPRDGHRKVEPKSPSGQSLLAHTLVISVARRAISASAAISSRHCRAFNQSFRWANWRRRDPARASRSKPSGSAAPLTKSAHSRRLRLSKRS